jgi:hypothetical protein
MRLLAFAKTTGNQTAGEIGSGTIIGCQFTAAGFLLHELFEASRPASTAAGMGFDFEPVYFERRVGVIYACLLVFEKCGIMKSTSSFAAI